MYETNWIILFFATDLYSSHTSTSFSPSSHSEAGAPEDGTDRRSSASLGNPNSHQHYHHPPRQRSTSSAARDDLQLRRYSQHLQNLHQNHHPHHPHHHHQQQPLSTRRRVPRAIVSGGPADQGDEEYPVDGQEDVGSTTTTTTTTKKCVRSVDGGVEGTYQCQFCDKTFPRLGYLKKHEQV